jgi:hypothetical protein
MSNLRDQLNELLKVEEKVDTLELENKALRFQNETQAKLILELRDDLRYMDRYRMVVERASILARDLPQLREELLRRKQEGL